MQVQTTAFRTVLPRYYMIVVYTSLSTPYAVYCGWRTQCVTRAVAKWEADAPSERGALAVAGALGEGHV